MKNHKSKDFFTLGFEKIMNTHSASMLHNPQVFNEIINASGMTASEAIRHIGKGTKNARKEDAEKSKQRLDKLEQQTENK